MVTPGAVLIMVWETHHEGVLGPRWVSQLPPAGFPVWNLRCQTLTAPCCSGTSHPTQLQQKSLFPFVSEPGFLCSASAVPHIPCSAHSTLLRCKTPRQDVLIKGVCLKCRITAAHSVFSGVMLQRDKGTPKKPPLWKSWGKVMRAVSEQALGGKLD